MPAGTSPVSEFKGDRRIGLFACVAGRGEHEALSLAMLVLTLRWVFLLACFLFIKPTLKGRNLNGSSRIAGGLLEASWSGLLSPLLVASLL